jgi:diacylglycerol kinase (ATP)
MNNKGNSPYNLVRSFFYAFYGIAYALRHERNLRIHFLLSGYMLYFSRYYAFSRVEYALLLLVAGFVITCEMVNTAVENTVDLKTSTYNSRAKIAKDVAAGAVLVSALTSIAVGLLLFWEPPVLARVAQDLAENPLRWAILFAASLVVVFLPANSR